MKKIVGIIILAFTITTNAQTLSYNDIGVLFSKESVNGSARFNGMSGAFGALGGDISAIDVNPAGAAVFLNSEFSLTLNNRNTQIQSTYYNNLDVSKNDYTNFQQVGGVFVFNTYNSNWNKIAVAFNYSVPNDFENFWLASGNSNYPTFTKGPNDIIDTYIYSTGQYFENYFTGKNGKYTFTLAAQNNDNLYVGISLSTYDIKNYQYILLQEYNDDNNGNTLDASFKQELLTYGNGISFNFGVISKPSDNLRLGLAYQSPVWYNLSEDYVDSDLTLNLSNNPTPYTDYSGISSFDYRLRTPSKLTGSFAYIFNKQGLISLDYIYKNYRNIQLSNGNFSTENQAFNTDLKAIGEVRIGTEWRFDNLSLRGGYHFEKNPYKSAITSDNIEGFSLGAGYKFSRGVKFDIAYQKSSNTAPYNFYPQYNQINSADLKIDNSIVTATLVIKL